jgi:tripartite-type tricarboxylate transporter receptor subunit TctC
MGVSLAGGVHAQQYPARPVRLIVPYASGGGVDIMGRIIAAKAAERLGAQMIVENRGGGGTIIGTEAVAKAAPDGYTLLFANPALAAAPALNANLPYDTLKSLAPVIMVAASFNVLVAHPSLPVKSVKDLVALARSKPGQLNYASAGDGSAIYLAMAMFQNTADIELVHIPYKGAGPALIDVVGGQVPMMFIASPPAVGFISAGKLRGLGVSSARRLAILPDIPTIAESGYPGFEVNNWYSVMAPADTPSAVIARLNAEINAILAAPEVRQRIAALGAEPAGGTPEQFGRQLKVEMAAWAKVFGKPKTKNSQ